MKPAFHEGATIFGYVGDELFAGPIQGLFDWNEQNGPAKEILNPQDAEQKIRSIPGVIDVFVEIVWEPLWDREMMSDEAKLQLGMM